MVCTEIERLIQFIHIEVLAAMRIIRVKERTIHNSFLIIGVLLGIYSLIGKGIGICSDNTRIAGNECNNLIYKWLQTIWLNRDSLFQKLQYAADRYSEVCPGKTLHNGCIDSHYPAGLTDYRRAGAADGCGGIV